MVTGLAKRLKKKEKRKGRENEKKESYTESKLENEKYRGDIHIASSLLAHTRSSVCSLGLLFAQSSMSWATDQRSCLLQACFPLKILSFLIFQRFSIPAAKQIGQAFAAAPCFVV
jgi:hypothetical protein